MIICKIKGGFGNQLFQFATGYNIALKNNTSLKLDLTFYKDSKYSNSWRLNKLNVHYEEASPYEIFKLKSFSGEKPILYKLLHKAGLHSKYFKKSHIIDSFGHKPSKKIVFAKDHSYIEGWCVKEMYFHDIKDLLIKMYTPKDTLSKAASMYLSKIINSNSVSIHIRRGDYIGNPVFENLKISYYQKAIKTIKETIYNPEFFIFSDDIAWSKRNLGINNMNYVELEKENRFDTSSDLEDFFLMKNCKNNIIANSSYSWWAAYLNENLNKKVIAPSKWYKDVNYQKSFEQYSFIPSEWIQL